MDRAQYLGRLEAEARQADWCGEARRAAELRDRIRRMSAGTAVPPARETAARRPARSKG